ncbi:helix-turn-helix domain-containing protein [Micromonospora sp. NPDC051925]|uniref:helix-turn-helix domain-containing protein n=1 Tax=Micromonospora sp. NPDC051925 TaxID=3364288 RepID=UPI0037C6CC88
MSTDAVMLSLAAAECVTADPVPRHVTPEALADARRLLGTQLRAARRGLGVTQSRLAKEVRWSRSTIANVEIGRQPAPREFWVACDIALGANGVLVARSVAAAELARRLRDQATAERIRQVPFQAPHMCVCRDLHRLLRELAAMSFLDAPSAASGLADERGHG